MINKGRKVDCVPCNLVPRSIGWAPNNSAMLGLGALTSYSPSPLCSFCQRIFLFFIEIPPNVALSHKCPQHPQSPVQLSTMFPSTPPELSHTPPFAPTTAGVTLNTSPLPPLATTAATIFSVPFSRPPKQGHFPSYRLTLRSTPQILKTAINMETNLYISAPPS